MIAVHLHGPQAHLLDGPFMCEVDTMADAIKALGQQVAALKPIPGENRIVYEVAGMEHPDELFHFTNKTEIHLVPAVAGGGGKGGMGIISIVVGIIIIAVAWWNPGGWFAAGAMISQGMVMMMGASMILSGLVSLMMTPTPDAGVGTTETQSSTDPAASRYLGQPKNTVKVGTRINIPFGLNKIGGHYLSFNIDTTEGTDTPYNAVVISGNPDIAPDGSAHTVPSARYPVPIVTP